ncbi:MULTISPECIES: lysis system i-spanin subunit Rz [Pseudomonas]|uniref:lysis system i-spanin subunit Rz n=1 Tax=Pseudomonas TaxID=286 RepID=UPI001C65FDC3|nr:MULTISPECIES: lysis system i-spanin subunit Rz [unclassified Pseudomonas]MBW8127501.1 lysis protein [Pseudomonas sp. LAP_36]MBW8139277.1 lysis protein [Pseudomonas sp. PAMC 26818]
MIRYLIAALAACLVLIYGGWSQIKGQAKDMAIAKDRITTLELEAASRKNTQRLLAQLDTEHTKALTDAQNANNQLRTAVATGAHRLSVKATCPATTGPAATAGLGNAEARAELDPATAERIVAIANDGDEGLIALRAAQDYINTVCLGVTTQKGQ